MPPGLQHFPEVTARNCTNEDGAATVFVTVLTKDHRVVTFYDPAEMFPSDTLTMQLRMLAAV